MVKTNRLGTLAAAGGALGAVGLLMLLMLVVGVQPSEATFPGKNGRIVFERQQWLGPLVGYGPVKIFAIRPDATGLKRVTKGSTPNFSPNGRRIAFVRLDQFGVEDIYIKSPWDTGKVRNVTKTQNSYELSPAWSPDGRQIAYISANAGFYDLYVMLADGTNPTNITNSPEVDEQNPSWQPKPLSDG